MTNEAISLFKKSINISPFIIDYQLKLVSLYIEQRDFSNAEKILSNLKELNPERKRDLFKPVIYTHFKKRIFISRKEFKDSH